MCEHRQRVPPRPVPREDTQGHALLLTTCTVLPWTYSHTQSISAGAGSHAPQALLIPTSTLSVCKPRCHWQPLLTHRCWPLSPSMCCVQCAVYPKAPRLLRTPAQPRTGDEGAQREVCRQGVFLTWLSGQDPSAQPRQDHTKPFPSCSRLLFLQWIHTCHHVSAHLCSRYIHWLVLALLLCFFYNLRC